MKTISKIELTRLVNEEAKKMRDIRKAKGDNITFNECKEEVRKTLIKEYNIV